MLRSFDELGLKLWIENNQLKVSGLSALPSEEAEQARRRIRENKAVIMEMLHRPQFKIERMTRCLHQKPCKHLISKPPERPYCAVNGVPIFDLGQCPKGLWFNS